jgi:F-type H+-transporting ATPase subunit epsilon
MDDIQLHILSPEGTLVKTAVSLVTLPGVVSPFTVLKDHAAMVTALVEGDVRYVEEGAEKRLYIREGFVEIGDNQVKVCVEV